MRNAIFFICFFAVLCVANADLLLKEKENVDMADYMATDGHGLSDGVPLDQVRVFRQ